jgi:hypothetical protein
MTSSSIQEIKKELRTLDSDVLQELCMRLAKYKKENKELLNYLLFESRNEQSFIENVKKEINELFEDVPSGNMYLIKKSIRKIHRFANRQIKYSGVKQTDVEIRIFFCSKMKEAKIPQSPGTVLGNLYRQQLKKIEDAFAKLPEDIRTDYNRELKNISS